jgi:Cys-tRNA(Pro)/Cys-tRNA(Cys) deacylase
MSTRAIRFLNQKKVTFEVVRYQHDEKGAAFAAKATGYPLSRTVKTLVVDLGHRSYALVLMPGDKQLSMKRLAKVCGQKRAAMVDAETAERITGYLVGGISPFGVRKKLPVVMDEGIFNFEQILINAGQRGTMLAMDPDDIRATLAARVAVVAQSKG